VAARRSEIYRALTDRIQEIEVIRTCEQRLRAYDDVPEAEQPAAFVVAADEMPTYQGRGLPPIWLLRYRLYIYARITNGDPKAIGSDALHDILTAIETKMVATAAEKVVDPNAYDTTLDGLCSHARIVGTIVKDEGALGEQAVAMVPIEVLTKAV